MNNLEGSLYTISIHLLYTSATFKRTISHRITPIKNYSAINEQDPMTFFLTKTMEHNQYFPIKSQPNILCPSPIFFL
jgi:hypothetical protein